MFTYHPIWDAVCKGNCIEKKVDRHNTTMQTCSKQISILILETFSYLMESVRASRPKATIKIFYSFRLSQRANLANKSFDYVSKECDEHSNIDNVKYFMNRKIVMPSELLNKRLWKYVATPHFWCILPFQCTPYTGGKINIGWRHRDVSFQIFPVLILFGSEMRISHAQPEWMITK